MATPRNMKSDKCPHAGTYGGYREDSEVSVRVEAIKHFGLGTLIWFCGGVIAQLLIHLSPKDAPEHLVWISYGPFVVALLAFHYCITWIIRED